MKKQTVTAYVSTRGRYFTSLPVCLTSILTQTHQPDKLIIFDDGEHLDLRKVALYRNLFNTMDKKKIEWEVVFGVGKGQVLNHQKALEMAKTEWIWRLDDDNVAEPTALENMLEAGKDPKVGAVGGLVLHPDMLTPMKFMLSSKIEDILLGLNTQWYLQQEKSEVDHLYSTFIYRKRAGLHGYCMELSPVGHTEETIFTYQMKMAGWKLMVEPTAVTWHWREGTGGIRTYNDPKLWEHDKAIFMKKLEEWGVKLTHYKFIVLDNGLGDHLVFKKILNEVKEKWKDMKLAVACCYPEVFDNRETMLLSIADAKAYFGNLDQFNIYKWMWDRKWDKPMVDAFRGMYL